MTKGLGGISGSSSLRSPEALWASAHSGDDPGRDFDDECMFDACGNIGCVDGWVADCFDGFCVNAEDGCDLCLRRCDWCNAKGADAQ